MARGERTITTEDAEESPQSGEGRGGGGGQGHKPECTGQAKSDSSGFTAFCNPRGLSGAAGATTCNLHPREPQHFSVLCKPNCWKKKDWNVDQAGPLRGVGREARNPLHSQSKSEQWVYLRQDFLGSSPKTKGCESGVSRAGSGSEQPQGPQPQQPAPSAESARHRAAHTPEVFGDPHPPGQGWRSP